MKIVLLRANKNKAFIMIGHKKDPILKNIEIPNDSFMASVISLVGFGDVVKSPSIFDGKIEQKFFMGYHKDAYLTNFYIKFMDGNDYMEGKNYWKPTLDQLHKGFILEE